MVSPPSDDTGSPDIDFTPLGPDMGVPGLGVPGLGVPAPGVTAVDHVGIATGDLDATVALYRDVFGMVEVHRETNPAQQVIEVMLAPAGNAAELDRADEPSTRLAQLQVLAPLSEDSTIARFLERSGPGLQQLALRVVDVEATSADLRERGLRLLYPVARPGTAGSMINFVHPKDAGGVLIELVQPPDPTATRTDAPQSGGESEPATRRVATSRTDERD